MEIKIENQEDNAEKVVTGGCGCIGCLVSIVIILACILLIKILRYLIHIDINTLI